MNDQELEHRLSQVEDRSKSNTNRIDQIEMRQGIINDLVTSNALIAQRMDAMEKEIKEIKTLLNEQLKRPGKRWESIVEKAITAAVGILIAYIALRIGLQ